MQSRCHRLLLPLIGLLFVVTTAAHAANSGAILQLGVGASYWRSIEDTADTDFDTDGLGWLLSARLFPESMVHLGLEVEQSPDDYAGLAEKMYAPAAYLIVGQTLYAGLGAGMYYYDGEFADDYFYALRVGLMFELIPSLYLDINGTYRFESFGDLDEDETNIDTDTVTLGAAVRIQF